MNSHLSLHELIYVSIVGATVNAKVVAAIASHARTANKSLGITGVLVFDGERFCQFLEGGRKQVVKLFERISVDDRHVDVDMVHQGPIESRHFQRFAMGYAYLSDVDFIGTVANLGGANARSSFVELSGPIDFGV